MKAIVILSLLLSAAGWQPPATNDIPWEPVPLERTIEPDERRIPEESSILRTTIDASIGAYRFLFSDQQADICAFTPSCSHYAQQAVDLYGPLRGILMAVDRLERCNWSAWSYAPRYYPVVTDEGRIRLSDPVNQDSLQGNIQR